VLATGKTVTFAVKHSVRDAAHDLKPEGSADSLFDDDSEW
jgi:hypothetical protein